MFDERGKKTLLFIPQVDWGNFLKPILYLFFTSLIVLLVYYTTAAINPIKSCIDDTPSGQCSAIKPFYCERGKLIRRASICGCADIAYGKDESCITKHQNNKTQITLDYTLREKKGEINYTIYKELANYFSEIPTTISYEENDTPERLDFKIQKIYEEEQRALTLPLILEIKKITHNKEDQFRIAVSLIQEIPFGYTNKTHLIFNQNITHQRYPYEVLFEQQGICEEKAELLTLLLKELGYQTAIFYYLKENHEAAAVACPIEHSQYNSGYCFIETTGPSIITNNQIIYSDGKKLESEPEIMEISNGKSLSDNMYEYKDTQTLIELEEKINTVGRLNVWELYKFNKLKEKYNLANYYRRK
ncbi:MAG: hypothetical protein OQK82_06595 [Candidatus Pacearchaeota archaeon]|nr:hypothetical protein [Candidatus Pacearchaeota archaeon]